MNYTPENISQLSFNSSIEYHSNARDGAFSGGHIAGYVLVHGNINYALDPNSKLQLKVENLLDQNYSGADTAGSYGRTISLGMKLNF